MCLLEENQGVEGHLLSALARRVGEVKAVVFSFVFSLSNLQRKSRKRGKRLAAA
jgi:hypothetical protein